MKGGLVGCSEGIASAFCGRVWAPRSPAKNQPASGVYSNKGLLQSVQGS